MWKSVIKKGCYWGVAGAVLCWPWFLHSQLDQYDSFFKIMLLFAPFTPNLGILSEGKDGIPQLWGGALQTAVNGVYFFLLGIFFHSGLTTKRFLITLLPVGILFFTWIMMLRFWGYIQ